MSTIPEEQLNISGGYQFEALVGSNVFRSNWHANKMGAVRSLIKKKPPISLLDMGAGSGIFEYLFNSDMGQTLALDHHQKAVDFMKKLFEKNKISDINVLKLSVAKLENLKSETKYDVILMLDIIEHLEPATVDKMLAQTNRFLSDKGVIIVTTPNYKGVWPLTERLAELSGFVAKMDGIQHINKYNKESLAQKFNEFGYKIEHFSTINNYSYLCPIKSLAKKLVEYEIKHPIPFGNLLLCSFRKVNK